VLSVDVWGELSFSDVQQVNRELLPYFHRAAQPVHVVVNVSRLQTYPLSVSRIRSACEAMSHVRMGWLVVYGVEGVVIPIMLSVIADLARFEYKIVPAAADALQFLHDQDTASVAVAAST
jgi:hypothetical protein